MRFGAHSYMFTDRWSDECLGILDAVGELGLDFFEIGVGDDVRFSAELTRRRAEGLGIELGVGPGGHWPLECDLSSDGADERQAGLDWHCGIVDRAHAIGATAYCGSLYGHPGVVKRRKPPPGGGRAGLCPLRR